MKQKYLILKNDEKNELIIREFLEINKEMFSLVCEETYDNNNIESAIAAKDRKGLISVLRTNNMYPIGLYADRIAESIITMYGAENKQPIELLFDDVELFVKAKDDIEDLEDIEDKILDDDDKLLEDDFDDHKPLKTNCSIKVADDEPDDDVADPEETK